MAIKVSASTACSGCRQSLLKNGGALTVFLVLVFFCLSAGAAQNPEETLRAIVKVRSRVPENARTARILGTEREGNGVVIDSNGLILTIGYLILEADAIAVVGPEGEPIEAAFVGYDHDSGFGLIRASRPLSVTPMKLGRSSDLKEGGGILVSAHGGTGSAQAARVVSRREFTGSWEYLLEDAIFTSPPHPNFGGAAMIGIDGRLLGIGSLMTRIKLPGFGSVLSNMFVPIDLLKPILADLIENGRSQKPPRPWLGVNAEEVRGRVFVNRVTAGGPADRAGLKAGDIVLEVDKKPVTGLADFYRNVWAIGRAGVDVPLRILKGSRIRNIIVHTADRYRFLVWKKRP
ncbi:MAG: S1C family serine protease [bacterium]